MSRVSVIQPFLDLFKSPRYLEIGVSQGVTFHGLKAHQKVAVDPVFLFDVEEARAKNPNSAYHQMESDSYFLDVLDERDRFDIIFIDGLHVFEQVLRDFTNAIAYLEDGGVIVIDDVIPNSYEASLPNEQDAVKMRQKFQIDDYSWMGDVYKLVFFIDAFFPAFTYRNVSDSAGMLVVWAQKRDVCGQTSVEDVARKSFADVVLNRDVFHDARLTEIVQEFETFRASRGR